MKAHLASALSLVLLDAATGPDAAVTGAITFDVLAAQGADAPGVGPEWIKLAPRGKFTARDGRQLEVDPELLVERFKADGVAVPIDIDHAIPKKTVFGDAAPAVGWLEELDARQDGLFGRVSWLEDGLATLKKRSHRYISPALKTDKSGKAVWLHSAGLVAAPGISMPAVAAADPTHNQEPPMLKKIAQALGLNEAADEATCLSAIATFSQRVDPSVHEQTLQTLSATTAELTAIKTEGRTKKVNSLLEGALTAKKIVPAQRAHFESLCATDDGLASVEALLAATAPGLAASGLDTQPPAGGFTALSVEDLEMIKTLGLTEEDYRKANGLAAA